MNYNHIRKMDVSNGPGIRVSLFTQGCSIRCEGCFNSELWNFNEGKPFTSEIKDKLIKLISNPNVDGLSVLGGEPLSNNNISVLIDLFKEIKEKYPNKTIWVWTGYNFERFYSFNWFWRWIIKPSQKKLFENIDVLIDGQYKKDLQNTSLKYRGSSNQRVIDVQRTMKENKIVLYETGENVHS